MADFIVSTDWLNANLKNEKVIILDASIKPVTSLQENIVEEVIPGAKKFDLKNVFSDNKGKYEHTLPVPEVIIKGLQGLGINDDSIIILYDNQGVYSSPRAWFMIKSLGHREVYVLDGGLPNWTMNKLPTQTQHSISTIRGNFSGKEQYEFFCNAGYIEDCYSDINYKIFDARSKGRFLGVEAEPREGLKSGHIPGSHSFPFNTVLHNGSFLGKEALKAVFSEVVTLGQELVFSCGSGITSCVPAMAAMMVGYQKVKIYDGSWSEWGDVNNDFSVNSNL